MAWAEILISFATTASKQTTGPSTKLTREVSEVRRKARPIWTQNSSDVETPQAKTLVSTSTGLQ
jgi:hypothetical protein